MDGHVRKRVDEATTDENKWNFWPNELALVDVQKIDLKTDKYAIRHLIDFGFAAGRHGVYRQITPRNIPPEVGYPQSAPVAQIHFGLADPKGQGDDETRRNIIAFWQWSNYKTGEEYLFRVELGCKHDYDTAGSRMCYHVGKCRKCGHHFVCDSSD